MSLRRFECLSEQKARQMAPLQLAYIGDTIWDFMIRSELVNRGLNHHHMHIEAVNAVNANAQASSLAKIIPVLSENELYIVQRGRNAHAKHPVPHNQSPADYASSTAFEALLGYLYLTGQDDRIIEITDMIRGG